MLAGQQEAACPASRAGWSLALGASMARSPPCMHMAAADRGQRSLHDLGMYMYTMAVQLVHCLVGGSAAQLHMLRG